MRCSGYLSSNSSSQLFYCRQVNNFLLCFFAMPKNLINLNSAEKTRKDKRDGTEDEITEKIQTNWSIDYRNHFYCSKNGHSRKIIYVYLSFIFNCLRKLNCRLLLGHCWNGNTDSVWSGEETKNWRQYTSNWNTWWRTTDDRSANKKTWRDVEWWPSWYQGQRCSVF